MKRVFTRKSFFQIIGILWSKACRHFPLNGSNDNCLYETPKLGHSLAFWEPARDLDRCLLAIIPQNFLKQPHMHVEKPLWSHVKAFFFPMGLSGPDSSRVQGTLSAFHKDCGNLAPVCRCKQISVIPLDSHCLQVGWRGMMLELPGTKRAFPKEGTSIHPSGPYSLVTRA